LDTNEESGERQHHHIALAFDDCYKGIADWSKPLHKGVGIGLGIGVIVGETVLVAISDADGNGRFLGDFEP
jgi:hypothetical protein